MLQDRPGRPPLYPWNEARVGDTFTLPFKKKSARAYVCGVNRKFKIAAQETQGIVEKRFQCVAFDEINKTATVRRMA